MYYYQENDKIMFLETGEVLTVVADMGEQLDRGIVVRENFGRNLAHYEVRPAGRTRQRWDAAQGITPPEPPPPRPEESHLG